ncbi:MAG: hypothetical protein ACW99G_00385 [Candidatus Thorarchaeota archaeon]|jgi:hypothetical protein
MDYIISIENTPYMRWQAALFEESLKIFGLEDNLVVACAASNAPPLPYKRVVYHENVGRDKGYLCLNRAKGLLDAVKTGAVKQPFVSVDPDSFMLRPVPPTAAQVSAHSLFYVSSEVLNKRKDHNVLKMLNIDSKNWPGVGCCYQFANAPVELFQSIYTWTEKMMYLFEKKKGTTEFWELDIMAYNVALMEVEVEVVDFYESPLNNQQKPIHEDPCFIHYCNGVPPYFDKRKHNVNNWFSMGPPLPFQLILDIPEETTPVLKFKEVVSNYLTRNPNMAPFLS